MVDWRYLAGFFDGEGCIALNTNAGCATPRVSLVQSGERGKKVLQEIKDFLGTHGLLFSGPYSSGKNPKYQPGYVISAHSYETVSLFLRDLLPFLHVKKTEAQDMLRYLTLFPSRRKLRRKK